MAARTHGRMARRAVVLPRARPVGFCAGFARRVMAAVAARNAGARTRAGLAAAAARADPKRTGNRRIPSADARCRPGPGDHRAHTRYHALVYDAFSCSTSATRVSCRRLIHAQVRTWIELIVSHGDNTRSRQWRGCPCSLHSRRAPRSRSGRRRSASRSRPPSASAASRSWEWNGVAFPYRAPARAAGDARERPLLRARCAAATIDDPDRRHHVGGRRRGRRCDARQALGPASPSRTSSSSHCRADPTLALVSTGYRNHFNHPNPAVVARYAASGSDLLNTSQSGFVDVRFRPGGPPHVVERGRVDRHPYWREQ